MKNKNPAPVDKPLTPKQKLFVKEYLIDLNGSQAAIRAGYSKRSARAVASENLTKPNIRHALSKATDKRAKKLDIDTDWVLAELIKQYEASVAKFLETDDEGKRYISIDTSSEEDLALLSELQMDVTQISDEILTNKVKIKIPDRLKALDMIGRHVNIQAWKDNLQHTGEPVTKIVVEVVKAK